MGGLRGKESQGAGLVGLRFERRGMATNRGLLLDDWWLILGVLVAGIQFDIVCELRELACVCTLVQ